MPGLYLLFSLASFSGIHIDPDSQVVAAHATSLLAIIPTAVAGTATYHRAGLIEWRTVAPMAAGAAVASVVGARIAVALPSALLKGFFGLFLVAAGIHLLRPSGGGAGGRAEGAPRVPPLLGGAFGLLVGLFSALLGVGGGLVAIPFLIHVARVGIARVAASSLAIVPFAALGGVVGYMFPGWEGAALPRGAIGHVFLPAGLAMIPGAVLSVRWGTLINRKMGSRALTLLFAIFFILLGLRLTAENLFLFLRP